MIVYKEVLARLKDIGYTSFKLAQDGILGQATLSALRNNKPVNTKTINTLCRLLKCQPGDILEYIEDPTEK